MIAKLCKETWELICLVLLALPAAIVGYVGGFVINGLVTGFALQQRIHSVKKASVDSNKTSP